MTARIAITCLQMQNDLHRHRDRLEAAGYELVVPTLVGQRFETDDLITVAAGCVGLIAGDDDLGRRSLEGLPDLKVLIRWGIGTDSVDFDAAAECGIVVRNTPGSSAKRWRTAPLATSSTLLAVITRSTQPSIAGSGSRWKASRCTMRCWVSWAPAPLGVPSCAGESASG